VPLRKRKLLEASASSMFIRSSKRGGEGWVICPLQNFYHQKKGYEGIVKSLLK